MGKWREKFDNWVKSLPEKKRVWSTKQTLLISAAVVVGAIVILAKCYPFEGIGEWTGFGKDTNESESVEETIKDGKVISSKKTKTKNFQSAKTLWDWLGLGGTLAIPVLVAILGYQFQRREQKRASEQAKLQTEIAATNLRESALEAYIDRMSELLIDKELKVLIGKEIEESDPEYQKRDAALDIVRARTLSVLRRLDRDGERKGSVIRFLIDAELISKLNLSGADLTGANLESAILSGAHLEYAILSGAHLEYAILREANLSGAILREANLEYAILERANLESANLSGAILERANLWEANLREANLWEANLREANLWEANLRDANLRDAKLWDAKLWDASLERAQIESAKLSGADLESAILERANLSGANLESANLSEANLKLANLREANLSGAHLEYAILNRAKLSGAKLEGATLNEETILPDGSKYQSPDQLAKFINPDTTS